MRMFQCLFVFFSVSFSDLFCTLSSFRVFETCSVRDACVGSVGLEMMKMKVMRFDEVIN
jgi:hypothetical protein